MHFLVKRVKNLKQLLFLMIKCCCLLVTFSVKQEEAEARDLKGTEFLIFSRYEIHKWTSCLFQLWVMSFSFPWHTHTLSLSWRESPLCSSALPNKPEWDSLADSCSRWHYYSKVSQSAGSGSTTGGGGCPSAVPMGQHQHQHMALLCNVVSVGWYSTVCYSDHTVRSHSFVSFMWYFNLTKAGLKTCFPFYSSYVVLCTERKELKKVVTVLSWK